MTHSLHRFRICPQDTEDFVFLCTPAIGVNHKDSRKRLIDILKIVMSLEPVNINFYEAENTFFSMDKIITAIHDTSRIRCCFAEGEKVKQLLSRLQAEDYGLSVVISGPFDDIMKMLDELEISPHTVNISCGCFGRTEKLPDVNILRIIGMCGHGLISKNLIKQTIEDVRAGTLTVKRAARLIGRPCSCGIFNPKRTESILRDILAGR